jgi:hypothetical protein
MVLTRRAAKKQLEEEAKKETLVVGCQDAKIAEQDSENVQPTKEKQKTVINAKTEKYKRRSLAPNENQQILGIKEEIEQSLPDRASASPLALPIAAAPISPIVEKTTELSEECMVDNWKNNAIFEETVEEVKVAAEDTVTDTLIVAPQSPVADTTPPIPAFITELAKKPLEINLVKAEDFEDEQQSSDDEQKKKHNPASKAKGFTALHNTRKDHSLATKHKSVPSTHHDIVHPAPAALVEAVQMSADSLQAQLDALTISDCQPASSSIGTPYFQRNPESAASVANHLAALSSQLHRLTLCVGTLQAEIAAAATPQIHDVADRHFFALDTCALMHRSPTLDALIDALIKQNSISTSRFISVLVPLELVRELDGLKESRDEQRRSSARKAISLLRDLQSAHNQKQDSLLYRGQRQNELLGPRARRGDDGILDCMTLFKNAGAAEVNLVTQDNNLSLRAQTEGFKAMNVDQALDFIASLNRSSAKGSYLQAASSARAAPAPKPAKVIMVQSDVFSRMRKQENNAVLEVTRPPPPPCDPRPVASKQQEKGSAVAPPPPRPPPPGFLPIAHPVAAKEEENRTPNVKQRPNYTPITFVNPESTPLPASQPLNDGAAPATSQKKDTSASAAEAPMSITKWLENHTSLVRNPNMNSKQWAKYKIIQYHSLVKQGKAPVPASRK